MPKVESRFSKFSRGFSLVRTYFVLLVQPWPRYARLNRWTIKSRLSGFALINRGTIKVRHSGFSLIEVLIAISVIAVITVVSLPNLRQYNKDREFTDTVAQFQNILRTAQSSGANNIKCPDGSASTSWQVQVIINPTGLDSYSLIANCLATAPKDVQILYTNTFSNGQTNGSSFQATTNCNIAGQSVNIFFTGRKVTFSCVSGGTVVQTTISSSTQAAVVIVDQGGIIRIQ